MVKGLQQMAESSHEKINESDWNKNRINVLSFFLSFGSVNGSVFISRRRDSGHQQATKMAARFTHDVLLQISAKL